MQKTMLRELTLAYWEVSKVWNGQSTQDMAVGDALTSLRSIRENSGPHRILAQRVNRLSADIIQLSEPKKKRKAKKNVLSQPTPLLDEQDSINV